jgi:hypothetical protein
MRQDFPIAYPGLIIWLMEMALTGHLSVSGKGDPFLL